MAATVTARARKRCPGCLQLVQVGETAVLTDDRYVTTKPQWFGREYRRGAWHLWHPSCHASTSTGAQK